MERSNTYLLTCEIVDGQKPQCILDAIKFVRKNTNVKFTLKFRGRNKNRKQFYDRGGWDKMVNGRRSRLRQDLPLKWATHADVYLYITQEGMGWQGMAHYTDTIGSSLMHSLRYSLF